MSRVIIAGGGIGGMATALSLHAAGLTDVEVYESAASIRELGVGLTLQPHAVRELAELGLLDELSAAGVALTELAYFTKRGQRIWAEPRGLAAGHRWPQLAIHRGELLMVLYRAVLARLGPGRVHTGHHLARFGDQRDGSQIDGSTAPTVWAQFTDRRTGQPLTRVEGDVLVGADGGHSVVRRVLYPQEGPPPWTGITMWRGTTEAEPFLGGHAMARPATTGGRSSSTRSRSGTPTGAGRWSTGSPCTSAALRNRWAAKTGTTAGGWKTCSNRSATTASTGWTCPACSAGHRRSTSTR
jgi:2-polyprenyl-6-methoxyphenol hydroxylase-like FAD-dependent oxidoreductase